MDWLFFALLSTGSFAATVIIDKLLLSHYVRNATAYLIALIMVQQIFAAMVFAAVGASFKYPISIYGMLIGAAQAAMYMAYIRALQIEEATRVTSLIFVYPIFVFVGAALLGETLTSKDYAGGLLLVLSALLISYKPRGRRALILSPALKHLVLFWLFSAIYVIGVKYLLSFMDEWHLFIWSSIGTLLSVLPLMAERKIRDEIAGYMKTGSLYIGAIVFEEVFDFLGRISLIFALFLGPVALVSAVGALQPAVTLVYVLALSIFVPGLLDEELDRRTLTLKFIAGILVAIGVYLVT
jgi:drug/metabolite transporter (DMT)-like permease